MNIHADKTQKNKNNPVTNEISNQQVGSESAFKVVDNRPEAIAQGKFQEIANKNSRLNQLKAFREIANNYTIQQQNPIQKKKNNTGLPDNLKTGIENISGYSMDDVKVHYNSDKPAQLQAYAYAQGTDIHIASGQEKHLSHEAWHVVQQKQGRVKPTMQMKFGANVNDDEYLENEASMMGNRLLQLKAELGSVGKPLQKKELSKQMPVQRAVNLASFTHSQNQHYALDPGNSKVLYGLLTAPAPAPTDLYRRETEIATNTTLLYRYKPNVRLYSKAEKNIINEWYDGASEQEQAAFSVAKPGTVRGLISGVENPKATTSTDRLPTLGMLGDNDCKGFATTLRDTIAGHQGVDNSELTAEDEPEVGDQMVHTFSQGAIEEYGLNCDKHSATIVAKDGNSLITLEAHAGQDITEPDFHMRNGIAGFIADNNQTHDLGNESSIIRANGSDESLNIRKDTFNTTKENPMTAVAAPINSWSMVSDVNPIVGLRRQALLSIKALSSRYWGKYTEWKFKPTGVSAIQTIVTGVDNTPEETEEALTAAKLRAIQDQARESDRRHPATADFYMAIARMNVNNVPSLLRVLRDMAHITREMEAGHTGK